MSLFHLTETSAGQALVGGDDGKGSIKLWTLRWHQMRRIGYL
jgi:hypothetical protein